MVTLLSIFFILICLLLIFMVVITPSNEGGMAAAFGGMGSDTFFGTKAHQHISKFTVFLAVSFLLLAIFINQLNARNAPTKSGSKLAPAATQPAPAGGVPAGGLPTGTGPQPPAPPPNK